MSMFNNIVMDKERRYRNLFAEAKTLVLPGARVRKHVVERQLQRTSRNMRNCRTADG